MNFAIRRAAAGALLAALTIGAAAPAAAAIVTFTGSFTNTTPAPAPNPACAVGQVLVNFSPGNATVSGASDFGAFLPSQTHCISPPSLVSPTFYSGLFSFDFGDLGILSGTTSGILDPIAGMPGFFDSQLDYTATGGTLLFAGASGLIHGSGLLNRTIPNPINELTLNGRLDLPAVPEPATWALMILGFGLAGAMLRRRRIAFAQSR